MRGDGLDGRVLDLRRQGRQRRAIRCQDQLAATRLRTAKQLDGTAGSDGASGGVGSWRSARTFIILVSFADMLWLVVREEVPANQRDMVTLLLGTRAGMADMSAAW